MAESATPRRNRQPARSPWIGRIKLAAAFFCILFLVVVAIGLVVWIPINQEAADTAANLSSKLVVRDADPSIIYSADGKVLFSIATERRKVIDLANLPPYVKYSIVAAEDRRFFDHRGVDYIGLLRVAFLAVREGHTSQGGSTIDMQLAKRMINGTDRSFRRKLKDIATAQQIENLKSKDEILNLYANQIYFGEGAFGIQAASETYFAKDASKLTIGEAAMLARCPRTPSRENPIKDLRRSMAQRDYVLDVMRDEKWITPEQCSAAKEEVPKINPTPPVGALYKNQTAGYFVDHVMMNFAADFPGVDLQLGGYRIYTTLNYQLQRAATKAVQETVRENRSRKVNNGAIVVIDQDGKILAEVGGPDYKKSQYNLISLGKRQPGSGFKPFVYATALKEGRVHLGQNISNEQVSVMVGDTLYRPKNNGKERVGGSMPIERAFALSYNQPAIHTILDVGPSTVAGYAKDSFGFRSHLYAYPSLALGTSEVNPLELAEGYSVFMLQGDRVHPYTITKVIGPDGTVAKEYQPTRFKSVFDPQVCQNIDELMRDVVEWGTGTAAIGVPNARGKTGTTNDAKDAWFNGYSDGLLGVAWVGNTRVVHGKFKALSMGSTVFGGNTAAAMWAKVMQAGHRLKLIRPVQSGPATSNVTIASRTADEGTVPAVQDVPDGTGTASVDPLDARAPKAPPEIVHPPIVPNKDPKPPKSEPDKTDPPVDNSDTSDDPATAPPPKKDPKPADTQDDIVEVEVCADTGLRATLYCPETVIRRFAKNQAPRRYCPLHKGN